MSAGTPNRDHPRRSLAVRAASPGGHGAELGSSGGGAPTGVLSPRPARRRTKRRLRPRPALAHRGRSAATRGWIAGAASRPRSVGADGLVAALRPSRALARGVAGARADRGDQARARSRPRAQSLRLPRPGGPRRGSRSARSCPAELARSGSRGSALLGARSLLHSDARQRRPPATRSAPLGSLARGADRPGAALHRWCSPGAGATAERRS